MKFIIIICSTKKSLIVTMTSKVNAEYNVQSLGNSTSVGLKMTIVNEEEEEWEKEDFVPIISSDIPLKPSGCFHSKEKQEERQLKRDTAIAISIAASTALKAHNSSGKSKKELKMALRKATRNIPTISHVAAVNGRHMILGMSNNLKAEQVKKINNTKLAINSCDEKNTSVLFDSDEEECFREDAKYNMNEEDDGNYDENRNCSTYSKIVWNESGFA